MAPAGIAAPLHFHHGAEEAFYVLKGVMTVMTPQQSVIARAGSFVHIPRGTIHTIANPEPAPVRWLTLISPGWMSACVEEESDLLNEAGDDAQDASRQAVIYEKYGLEIVGPLSATRNGLPQRLRLDQPSHDPAA